VFIIGTDQPKVVLPKNGMWVLIIIPAASSYELNTIYNVKRCIMYIRVDSRISKLSNISIIFLLGMV